MPQPVPPATPALDPAFLELLLDSLAETLPRAEPDTEQARAARRQAARLALEAMHPAEPLAAMLAAQAIAAHHAIMDGFRRAMQPELPPAVAARLRANATSLARMMQVTLRTLQARQAPEDAPGEATVPAPAPIARPSRAPRRTAAPPPMPPAEAAETDQPALDPAVFDDLPPVDRHWENMTMAERRAAYGYRGEVVTAGTNGAGPPAPAG
ncbi:MAG TPA: hypothetical protein VFW75_17700 [Acetobacteraceae bacterium]|nr:hypothetical protein [Acetobacteraceae bacterium]